MGGLLNVGISTILLCLYIAFYSHHLICLQPCICFPPPPNPPDLWYQVQQSRICLLDENRALQQRTASVNLVVIGRLWVRTVMRTVEIKYKQSIIALIIIPTYYHNSTCRVR